MDLAELWDRVVCLLYPPRCVLCGAVVEYDDLWCGKCPLEEVRRTKQPGDGSLEVLSPFAYEGGPKNAVLALKEREDRRTARFLAEYMAAMVRRRSAAFDGIVPVPANPARLKERGFNQAEFLAHALGKQLGIPVIADALERRDDTEEQHALTAARRRENARKSYMQGPGSVEGLCILLTDDVFTTGATLEACATRLRQALATQVCAITATYTPHKDE